MPPWTLVTGAAGFLAHSLVRSLLEAGVPVLGLDVLDDYYPRALKQRNLADLEGTARRLGTPFRFVLADVADIATALPREIECRAVVHLAARVGVRASVELAEPYLLTNVQATLRLLEWCRLRDVRTAVLVSSSSVYGETPAPFREDAAADRPISPYAASKRAAELFAATYARLYGLRVALPRLFTVYGPRQRPDLALGRFARALQAGESIRLFGGGSTRDYTFVDDTVAGLRAALRWAEAASPGDCEAFNVGTGRATPLSTVIALLAQELRLPLRLVTAPRPPGDVPRTQACLEKSAARLGYAPRVSLEEGIGRYVRWLVAGVE